MNKKTALFFLIATLFSFKTFAAQQIQEVNYFASLRSNETNVRAGPSQNYPIKFTFKLRGIPIRVISEYDNWLEIEDYEGETGWLNKSLITKKRTLMVVSNSEYVNFYKKPNSKSKILYHIENNVVLDLIKCSNDWCNAKAKGKSGWIEKSEIFGEDLSEKN
jgi:SH3-like domain-containing protein